MLEGKRIIMPDLAWEKRLGGLVAGIDEVGRGPLAGPVVAAAVIIRPGMPVEDLVGLDDSKKLDGTKRAHFAALLRRAAARGELWIGIGAASVEEIDRVNILQASFLAMARAVQALGVVPDTALVDGNRAPKLPCNRVETLVKGDGISLSIAAASVVAKVARDLAMSRLAPRYHPYGWGTNAGYGTAEHMAAIAAHGVTRHHRRSFAPVREALAGTASV
jgi:ribonuclease HII